MTTETLPRTAPLEPGTGTPLEPTTPIKPSEAIRLGCLTYPVQAFGMWRNLERGEGCAMDAMFANYEFDLDHRMAVLARLSIPCPSGHTFGVGIWTGEVGQSVAAHLNDHHRWSRERIAGWLEGLGL